MSDTDIPDVDDTDLTRDEMEEVAEELDLDTDGLDDQELLERLGVALGEIDESQVSDGDGGTDDAERDGSSGGLRATLAEKLEGAAAKLRPSEAGGVEGDGEASADGGADARDGGDDGEGGDPTEQDLPGEPIEGPTRDELRERLRELGLPVTGTKDELQARLDEAQAEQAETGGGDDGEGGDPTEQDLPGEPIEGPTRNELRDQLRELGLPVTGTKDELQARLDEARGGGDDGDDGGSDDPDASRMDRLRRKVAQKLAPSSDGDDASDDEGDASETDGGAETDGDADEGGSRLRDRFADRLDGVADRIRASGDGGDAGPEDEQGGSEDEQGGSAGPSKLKLLGAAGPSKLKLLGAAVKRKVTRG